MSNENDLISPIAIDLGAKNTGVYFAHYEKGKTLGEIEKAGRVYQLEKDAYTLLMQGRTASRHQRRGFDRRQMVKRLFKLIWEKHFGLEWDADIQQTFSFLLNRRGFSYLTEEYDADILREFPREVFDALPEVLRDEFGSRTNILDKLNEWQNSDVKIIGKKYETILAKIYLEKLITRCQQIAKNYELKEGKQEKNKLSALPKRIYDIWVGGKLAILSEAQDSQFTYTTKAGVKKTLPCVYGDKVNLTEYLKQQDVQQANKILKSISNYTDYRNESDQSSHWDFNSTELENIEEKKEGDFFYHKDREPNIKTHLHHLAFALHKIHSELESGGCHRSKCEEYDADILCEFPQEAFDELPQKVKKKLADFANENGSYNLASALTQWSKKDDLIKEIKETFATTKDKKLKNSLWNFKESSFDLEKAKETGKPGERFFIEDGEPNIKNHLHHFAFALHKIHSELESGGRHRSKYFDEIKNALDETDKWIKANRHKPEKNQCKPKPHGYFQRFCEKLYGGEFVDQSDQKKLDANQKKLDAEKLTNLIGHLSNLELKPLRKYFNDDKHKISKKNLQGDQWDEKRLAAIFSRWILSEWRINPDKDKDKKPEAQCDYKELCKQIRKEIGTPKEIKKGKMKGRVIDFFLRNRPAHNHDQAKDKITGNKKFYSAQWTIPPYQDNNNRRPPRCQSLILNAEYLKTRYRDWEKWFEVLKNCSSDYLGDFDTELENLKSGKGTLYFSKECQPKSKRGKKDSQCRSQQDLQARVLQFIFDRVKASDPLQLNEIFSHTKKIRQLNAKKEKGTDEYNNIVKKLETAINESKLPEELKQKLPEDLLPKDLKTNPNNYSNEAVFADGTFLHLVCDYYKQRQRARDGRIYIHPQYRYVKDRDSYENTGRFDDANCLLTYCNHKPRQKRYQMLLDIAQILFTSEDDLKDIMGIDEAITKDKNPTKLFERAETFFAQDELKSGAKTLKGFMKDCAEAQKKYRNELKDVIKQTYSSFEIIQRELKEENKTLSDSDAKTEAIQQMIDDKVAQIISATKSKDKSKDKSVEKSVGNTIKLLIGLKENSHIFAEKLAELIHKDKSKKEIEDEIKLIAEKFNNPHSFGQIYNIVYKERSGYSKTCVVCSIDNALRMQTIQAEADGQKNQTHTKAQRLPAIPTRVIDGAVMRMARIVGGAIAKDKWQTIKADLIAGEKVCVPIITESNRFEFEPSKEEIVKSQRLPTKKRKGKAIERSDEPDTFTKKQDRIKTSNKTCPYTGESFSSGEIDHIIPRKSKYGTLNDEANLIWASCTGNQHKTNNPVSLSELNTGYKSEIFPNQTDKEIEDWIIKTIWDVENDPGFKGDRFKFGPYRNFMNIPSDDEKKAFRHALFLADGHVLRDKVINAIDNRNRALVNGTQRYFAEVLANTLYKKAKRIGREKQLSFDYFGVEAQSSTRGEGIYDLRKEYEKAKIINKKDIKQQGKSQTAYSHLIDAQLAFCVAVDAHRNDGGLKLKVDDSINLHPVDKETGEITDKSNHILGKIQIPPKDFEEKPLKRQYPKPVESNFQHRPLFNENAVAMHFLKLIEIRTEGETIYLQGFLSLTKLTECLMTEDKNFLDSYLYAKKISSKEEKSLVTLYQQTFEIADGGGKKILENFGERKASVIIYSLDKTKVFEFLIEHFNSAKPASNWNKNNPNVETLKLLKKLWYFTKRKNVLQKKDKKIYQPSPNKLQCAGLVNPQLESAWSEFESIIDNEDDLKKQAEGYFLYKKDDGKTKRTLKHDHKHKKKRKVFSLPISCQKGYLIRKKNWQGKDIYYCRPAGNAFSQTVLHKDPDGTLPEKGKSKDERLSNIYRKRNIFDVDANEKNLQAISTDLALDSNLYYDAKTPKDYRDYIINVKNKRTDETRPQFQFLLNTDNRMDFATFRGFICAYPFRALQDLKASIKKEYFESENNSKFIVNEAKLQESIKEVEAMDKKPEELLPALKTFDSLWCQSQTEDKLEYQAKASFTLKAGSSE